MLKVEFYNELIRYIFSSWWTYMLLGANFIFLAVLIYMYPQLISVLIAFFLFFCGFILLVISLGIWSVNQHYKEWKKKHEIIVQ